MLYNIYTITIYPPMKSPVPSRHTNYSVKGVCEVFVYGSVSEFLWTLGCELHVHGNVIQPAIGPQTMQYNTMMAIVARISIEVKLMDMMIT